MNSRQVRALASVDNALVVLRRVKDQPPRVRLLVEELVAIQARVRAAYGQQAHSAITRSAPNRRVKIARDRLRVVHLVPLARDGNALLAGYPGIADSLRVPHKTASIEEHVKAATRFHGALAPHAKIFVKAKYPRDFLSQMQGAAGELETAAADPASGRNRYSLTTAQLQSEIRSARALIERLDAAICSHFYGQTDLIERWRHGKRIPARQGRPPRRGKRTT